MPLRVARARAAAERAAARAPAHRGGSQWTTSSASFPATGSRSLLRAEAPQVSVAAGSAAFVLQGSTQGVSVPKAPAQYECMVTVAGEIPTLVSLRQFVCCTEPCVPGHADGGA